MRRSFFISEMIILLIFLIPSFSFGYNKWISIGPEGGIYALVINPQTPDTLYVGAYEGLFKGLFKEGGESHEKGVPEGAHRKAPGRYFCFPRAFYTPSWQIKRFYQISIIKPEGGTP